MKINIQVSGMIKTINMMRVLLKRSDKIRLVIIAFMTGIAALWEVAGIGLVIPVVAAVINPELLTQNVYLKAFYDFSPFKEHRSFMLFTAMLLVANIAAKNLFSLLVIRLQRDLIYSKQHELAGRLFGKFMHSEYAFMTEHSPGELSARLGRVALVCEGTLMPILTILSDGLAIAALTAALLFFMPLELVLSLGLLLVLALIFYLPFRKVNSALSGDYQKSDDAASADRIAAFSGIKTVKSFGCEEYFIQKFCRHYGSLARVSGKVFLLGQIPRLGLEVLAIILAMGIFCRMVIGNVASSTIVLNFALLVAAMARIMPSLSRIHYNLTRLRQVDKLFEGLYNDLTAPETESHPENTNSQLELHLNCALEITDLEFAYPDGKQVFKDFSCRVPAHTSVAVIGATGCGKTTLADLIIGLYRPQQGRITFDKINTVDQTAAVRKITGYVPQYVFLTEGSIRENLTLGMDASKADENELQRVIELANLSSWIKTLPDGLDTQIGENGVKLSGGQRQRLGIARALYRKPELLILDEATSALDNASENAVVEALETLHGSMTMLVIAHRLSTIEHCDQIIDLEK